MKLPPNDDAVAILLRNHFMTEASDAGLRSPSLEGSPRSNSSPDAAFVARADSGRQEKHRAIRTAFSKLSKRHVDVLSLAYGCVFREREIDDGSRRKAPRKEERNWRALLRETYRLGDVAAIVLATEEATHAKGSAVTWLLSETAKGKRALIEQEAVEMLVEARAAFAAAYVPPKGGSPVEIGTGRRKGRPKASDAVRLQAFGGAHGREIGR